MTLRTGHPNGFDNRFCMAAIREIAAGIELTKTANLNDHIMATLRAGETSWLILDINLSYFFFGLGQIAFKAFIEGF